MGNFNIFSNVFGEVNDFLQIYETPDKILEKSRQLKNVKDVFLNNKSFNRALNKLKNWMERIENENKDFIVLGRDLSIIPCDNKFRGYPIIKLKIFLKKIAE